MIDTKRVLTAVSTPSVLARLQALQTPVELKFEVASTTLAFQARAWRRTFDLLIAQLPFPALEPTHFLRTLRKTECASSGSPVLFLTRKGCDHELNDIAPSLRTLVTTCTNLPQTLKVVAETLGLRDRLPVHLFAETEIILDAVRRQRVCQIENLSPTGMLLHTKRYLPLGWVVPFALRLPDDETPIYGRGEVVRHTEEGTEAVSGMGVRFFGLDGNGSSRLAGFLRTQAS